MLELGIDLLADHLPILLDRYSQQPCLFLSEYDVCPFFGGALQNIAFCQFLTGPELNVLDIQPFPFNLLFELGEVGLVDRTEPALHHEEHVLCRLGRQDQNLVRVQVASPQDSADQPQGLIAEMQAIRIALSLDDFVGYVIIFRGPLFKLLH